MKKMQNVRFYSRNSVRMCVVCRKRDLQRNLLRFKYLESHLTLYDGNGRSFYLCCECSKKDKIENNIKRIVKKAQNIKEQLEEILQICQK